MDEAGKSELRPVDGEPGRPRLLHICVLGTIACLYAGARLWHLTATCLWFDEIFSVHAARYGWSRMLSFVAADVVHPPFFYALLKVWIGIGGESLLWLRLLPMVLSVAAIIPFVLLCRELGLRSAERSLALLFMAVNGFLIKYAQEVRMYSLLLLLALCSLWLFLRLLRTEDISKRALPVLFAINLLLVYTHYYGWMVVALEVFYLYLREGAFRRLFFISVVALLICYVPWIYGVVTAERGHGLAQNIGWIVRPHLSDLAQFYELLHEPFYYRQSSAEQPYSVWGLVASLVLVGGPLLALLWGEYKKRGGAERVRSINLLWLLCFSFLPIALAFALGWVLPQSIWGTRHLIIVAGPYAILAAISVNRLQRVEARYAISLLLGCWFFLAGMLVLGRPGSTYIWCAWGELSGQMMEEQANEKVGVYAFEDLVAYHLWFALEEDRHERFQVIVIKGLTGLREDSAYFLPRSFDDVLVQESPQLLGDHIWMAFRDTALDESREPLKTALGQGYQVQRVLMKEAGGQRAFLVELGRIPPLD